MDMYFPRASRNASFRLAQMPMFLLMRNELPFEPMLFQPGIDHGNGVIIRTIVKNDYLKIWIRLISNAIETLFNKARLVIASNEGRHERMVL